MLKNIGDVKHLGKNYVLCPGCANANHKDHVKGQCQCDLCT